MSANPIKVDGKIKIAGYSKSTTKEVDSSPNAEKKLSSSVKSNIPKSSVPLKSNSFSNRPQSSYSTQNKEIDSNAEAPPATKTRVCKSKTPLGHSSMTISYQTNDNLKLRKKNSNPLIQSSKLNNTAPVSAIPIESPISSSPEPSPPPSPKLDLSLETSDDSVIVSDNADESIKAPFVIKKSEPENDLTLIHNHEEHKHAEGGKHTPACCHTGLLASKLRPLNKRPGHLRHLKSLGVTRMETLRDYLSIYEERLNRIKSDQPILLKETQLRCDEIISQIMAKWMGLKADIDQQYETLITEAETHKENIAKELLTLETLQKESSTLYDICDLEEDENNLEKWVHHLKDQFNNTLTNETNTDAMKYLPSISIEKIDSARAEYEAQILQLSNSISIPTPPVQEGSKKQVENPQSSSL